MGDPNGNEALTSSTAIGKIYPLSFILFLRLFTLIAFQIWISFQICPSVSNGSFWKIFKRILKLLKLTQTIALYIFIEYWFEIILTWYYVSYSCHPLGRSFYFTWFHGLACIFFNRAGWPHFQCNSMPRTCRRRRLVWTVFFQKEIQTKEHLSI